MHFLVGRGQVDTEALGDNSDLASAGSTRQDFNIADASVLHARVARLTGLLERVDGRLKVLELENHALRSCLEDQGVVRSEAYLAKLHRRSFREAVRRHPCHFEAKLGDVLLTRELRNKMGGYSGWSSVRACGSTARAFRDILSFVPQMIYICGGFDGETILSSMERFDPSGIDWAALERRQQRIRVRQQEEKESSSGGCFCAPCGADRGSEEELSLLGSLGAEGCWQPVAPMVQKRAGFAAAVVSGSLYVCGGYDGTDFLRSVERYFPETDTGQWETITPMFHCRHCPSAAAIDGRLYVCGGFNGDGALRTMERYIPASGAGCWEEMATIHHPRHGAAAAVLGGKLFICGGYDGNEALQSTERFDPCTGSWEEGPPMLRRRNVASAVAQGGRLYVMGGCDGNETLSSAEVLDPDASHYAWQPAHGMRQRRHGAAAAFAAGQVFICGGGDSAEESGRLLNSVERVQHLGSSGFGDTLELGALALPAPRIDMVAVAIVAPA
jgi:hypothetical protein